MRYAGSTDEAADMLNEGFLKVFSNLDKYENSGSFEAWLKRVVCNAALDYRRRYDKKVELVDIDEVQDSHLSDFNVNDAISNISSNEIVGLIQQLPPVTRTVFNMFLFEGFSHREIARQLNITESTSAWHVNNARYRLKEALKLFDNE
jgi:RNA polymerase sigma-70 factor (ECF subfamily)